MYHPKFCIVLVLVLSVFKLINTKDICDLNDPIKSCECYFDGHFIVQCSRSQLSAIPASNTIPKDVEVFDVSHNSIQKLEFDVDFESKTIRTFRASYNYIKTVEITFLRSLPHLTYLDLSHNQITKIEAEAFQNVSSMHYLDLSFNDLISLPEQLFTPIRNLRYLDLSYNQIGEQLLTYKSLISSNLGFNEKLETLRLNAVNLSSISNVYFENLTLIELSLADNDLKNVPLLPVSLISLDLSGNLFTSIAPRHLIYTKLKELYLNRLRLLDNIENYAFYNLIALEILEVEHCPKLKAFNDNAFGVLLEKEEWSFKRISLNGNALRQLNNSLFHLFNKVPEVDLSSNPWICDCGVTWIQLIRSNLINKRNMRCVAPRRLRNRGLMELNDEMLPKCNVQANLRVQKILTSVICILVLLLLGIIMYLIYLAPFKGNQSNRFIGQESPYTNNIVVREDDYVGAL